MSGGVTSAAFDPAVLAWALARPVGDRWRGLAEAFAAGTTRVSFDGRTVEYRSLAEIGAALAAPPVGLVIQGNNLAQLLAPLVIGALAGIACQLAALPLLVAGLLAVAAELALTHWVYALCLLCASPNTA